MSAGGFSSTVDALEGDLSRQAAETGRAQAKNGHRTMGEKEHSLNTNVRLAQQCQQCPIITTTSKNRQRQPWNPLGFHWKKKTEPKNKNTSVFLQIATAAAGVMEEQSERKKTWGKREKMRIIETHSVTVLRASGPPGLRGSGPLGLRASVTWQCHG